MTWAYGAKVTVAFDPTAPGYKRPLAVALNNKPLQAGQTLNLGPSVSIKVSAEKSGQPRTVDITVRPFIKIAITQPWTKPRKDGPGYHADYLNV